MSYDMALSVFEFIIQNAKEPRLQIQANSRRLELQLEQSKPGSYKEIKARYEALIRHV